MEAWIAGNYSMVTNWSQVEREKWRVDEGGVGLG